VNFKYSADGGRAVVPMHPGANVKVMIGLCSPTAPSEQPSGKRARILLESSASRAESGQRRIALKVACPSTGSSFLNKSVRPLDNRISRAGNEHSQSYTSNGSFCAFSLSTQHGLARACASAGTLEASLEIGLEPSESCAPCIGANAASRDFVE